MAEKRPCLTIGMPVFNGAKFLTEALESVLAQTFRDFELLISDNASTDETELIAKKFESIDSRIKYVRQQSNLGAIGNFLFVFENITTPYFMWFAGDDVMDNDFLDTCIQSLESNKHISMAFTGLVNIDSLGRTIREYPQLPNLAGGSNLKVLTRFLWEPEVFGKANLFYSVYRTSVLESVVKRKGIQSSWGSDMSFVFAVILEGGVSVSKKVLFRKRWVRDRDDAEFPINVEIAQDILNQSCPIECFPEYESATIDAARGTRFLFLTAFLMRFRYLRLLCLRKNQEQSLEKQSRFSASRQWVKNTYFSIEFAFKVLLK